MKLTLIPHAVNTNLTIKNERSCWKLCQKGLTAPRNCAVLVLVKDLSRAKLNTKRMRTTQVPRNITSGPEVPGLGEDLALRFAC